MSHLFVRFGLGRNTTFMNRALVIGGKHGLRIFGDTVRLGLAM